jgi:hypothetical protein
MYLLPSMLEEHMEDLILNEHNSHAPFDLHGLGGAKQ